MRKKGLEGPELVKHKVICMVCGNETSVKVMPDVKPPTHVKCYDCKTKNDNSTLFMTNTELRMITERNRTARKKMDSNVAIFKPGDRGFKSRAAQCTLISKIETRHGTNRIYAHW